MIHTSRKLAVIQTMLYLSCETSMIIAIIASDSAADTSGRRSTTIQKKFRNPQVSANTVFSSRSPSLKSIRDDRRQVQLHRSAQSAHSQAGPQRLSLGQRPVRNERERGMADLPMPGNEETYARHTSNVIKQY